MKNQEKLEFIHTAQLKLVVLFHRSDRHKIKYNAKRLWFHTKYIRDI